jgi:hypothetical protein
MKTRRRHRRPARIVSVIVAEMKDSHFNNNQEGLQSK